MIKETIVTNLNQKLNFMFNNIEEKFFEEIEEIRLRTNKTVIIKARQSEYYITDKALTLTHKNGYVCKQEDITKTLDIMSNRSLYAIQEDLKKGFLTLNGGHRVGITGQTVFDQRGIVTMKNINGLNIRICKDIKGCSLDIFSKLFNNHLDFGHTLIISPPACGKTTLLRDLIRNLSNAGLTLGVVDERNEISASHNGIATIDLGTRTDVLVNCQKTEGMTMLLRSMSPQVIAIDEIGTENDVRSLEMILNAGVKILATIHSYDIQDLKNKKNIESLILNKIFENYIVLSNKNKIGEIVGLYNRDFEECLFL